MIKAYPKRQQRIRRSTKTRAKIRNRLTLKGGFALTVHKTCKHIYAQIVEYTNHQSRTLVSASTKDKKIRESIKGKKLTKSEKAKIVGNAVAEAAKSKSILKVAFDRSGFKYHGCIKALADAAKETGLEI